MKEVVSWSASFIVIWWYPEYASRKHKVSHPVVESTTWSIHGNGCGTFGHPLFRLV